MHLLTDPMQFDFFTRALLAVVLVSVLCALVGAWVVLRGLSYIGDAMSHAVFPGIVGAFLMQGNLLVGALIAAVLTALGIGAIGRRSGLKQDSAIGIVFVGMFALGIVMLSRAPTFTTDLSNFLIGNPSASRPPTCGAPWPSRSSWAASSPPSRRNSSSRPSDPTEARAVGLPVRRLESLLLILIGLVVVLTVQLVGTTLSVSLLITSSAAAPARPQPQEDDAPRRRARHRRRRDGAVPQLLPGHRPGATIVLVNTAIFLAALALRRRE